jgi:hypothetical protein
VRKVRGRTRFGTRFVPRVHICIVIAALLAASGCGGSSASDEGRTGTNVSIEDLIDQLNQEGLHETYPVASIADIEKTEKAIGKELPQSFKTFLTKFSNGAYVFEIQEVSAVGDGNEQIVAIQNIYRETDLTADDVVPFRDGGETGYGNLVPFGLDQNANEWCFVVEGSPPGNEYAVAYLDTTGNKLYGRLSGFTEWLSILVEEQNEVIRTLYDDDVIYNELGLG